jgi:SAM-dependent methyltransferase
MILDQNIPELEKFRLVERDFIVAPDSTLEHQVVAALNENRPVHRWFRFKEAFAHTLLRRIIEDYLPKNQKLIRFLDPFCGTGTSLLSAQELSEHGYEIIGTGIERNPFVHFVAKTKIAAGEINLRDYDRLRRDVLKHYIRRISLPSLTSIRSGRCITRRAARRIVELRDSIVTSATGATRDALLLGLAASIEPLSKVRKDGRALRIVKKSRHSIDQCIADKWQIISDDVSHWKKNVHIQKSEILLGDGRDPGMCGVEDNSIDLILTSPPYPNNIDYSEVYKLELWLLGFVGDSNSFYKLRRSTFRSHPSIRPAAMPKDLKAVVNTGSLDNCLAPLLDRLEKEGEPWRFRMLSSYFIDLWSFLKRSARCLKTDGFLVVVIGNSLHGNAHLSFLVPSDLIVASMGRELGLEVQTNAIARALRRRLSGNHFLRESVVIMKKT